MLGFYFFFYIFDLELFFDSTKHFYFYELIFGVILFIALMNHFLSKMTIIMINIWDIQIHIHLPDHGIIYQLLYV